ncbi:hypothetical protein ACLE20_01225 [Rhizobium sp. YIM 134829]|uniref:hypothetical protein n=1 Tax=Rhizobium sp. YIM 134829 TaxID=3390453 RepID=UPI00397DFAEA
MSISASTPVPAAAAAVQASESSVSAVSWGAIIAGAVAASALTLLMTLLGSGLGLSLVSPTSNDNASAATVAVSAGIWLIIVQWLSSAFGGYLTGRLRTKWSGVHNDEAFFRDSAHGILAWALATLLAFGLLTSSLSSLIGTGVQAAASVTGATASTAVTAAAASGDANGTDSSGPTAYFVDSLLRPADPRTPPAGASAADATQEISRILANGATTGSIPEGDRAYLAQLVAARTGLSEGDANTRVDTVLRSIDEAKQAALEAADTARKASAGAALAGAISMLIGAFCAGIGAVVGGRQRDDDQLYLTR